MKIYSAIKQIALRKEISIYQIEKDLSLSNGLVSTWDKHTPSIINLQKVADYLDVTISSIMNKAKEDTK